MSEKEIHQLQKQIKELARVQAEANRIQNEANLAQTKAIKDISDAIQPMVDVYETFSKLGRWGTGFLKGLILILTVVSLVFGILFAITKKGQ